MRPFRDLPIGRKVTLLILLASGLSMLLVAAGVVVYDVTTIHPRGLRDATAQADVMRVNLVAALIFDDPAAARENLQALGAKPEVVAAAVYDSAGNAFAAWVRPPAVSAPFEPSPTAAGHVFENDRVTVTQPIDAGGQRLGWLVLKYALPPLWARLPQYGLLVGVVLLVLLTVSALLARMLRRSISTPLLRLADTAHTIGSRRDYSIRAAASTGDEIRQVTDAFNEMLATVEAGEAAVRDSSRRLQEAMDAAQMGHWRWDLGRDTITWGGQEARIFPPSSRPRDESLAAFLEIVHPADRSAVADALSAVAHDDAPCEFDLRVEAPGGRLRWLRMRGQAGRDAEGAVAEVFGLVVDVTDRRHLEEQLAQSQKMEAIGRLAGGIAHDFNNLLTAILGYARYAAAAVPPGSPAHSDVVQIQRAGERAATLTAQLLAYARRQVMAPRITALDEIVGNMEGMLQRLLGESIEVVVRRDGAVWPTRIDPAQLEQVLMNLVLNARDAMPEGGRIVLSATNVTVAPEEATLEPEVAPGDYVRLTVTDTGHGMDAETLARVFEPFFTTKEQGKGTGLGLAVCYGIIKQAGGHIWAESEPGAGSTFSVLLPRVVVAAAPVRGTA